MRRNLIAALLLAAGCAGSAKNEVAGGNTRLCSIADPQWASAARDFDRRSTLEVIAGLNKAARADLEQLKAGQRNDVGAQLDELTLRRDQLLIELLGRLLQLGVLDHVL